MFPYGGRVSLSHLHVGWQYYFAKFLIVVLFLPRFDLKGYFGKEINQTRPGSSFPVWAGDFWSEADGYLCPGRLTTSISGLPDPWLLPRRASILTLSFSPCWWFAHPFANQSPPVGRVVRVPTFFCFSHFLLPGMHVPRRMHVKTAGEMILYPFTDSFGFRTCSRCRARCNT
jgi:hypothetical protein